MNIDKNMLIKNYEKIVKNAIKNNEIHPNDKGIYKKSINMDFYGNRIVARGKDAYSIAVKLAEKHIEFNDRNNINKEKKKFCDILDEFYEVEIENSENTDRVKRDYKSIIDNHIKRGFGSLTIGELSYKDFQKFLNEYCGFGESLVKKIRMLLTECINYAKKCDYYKGFADLKFKLPKTVSTKERNALKDDELKAFLSVCKTHYAGDMFIIMLLCGLRSSELCQLEWNDINFDKKYVHIKKSKTNNGIRNIPLCPTAYEHLINRKQYCEENNIDSNFVFTLNTKHNTPYTTDRIIRVFKNIIREMNIQNGATVYRNQITDYVFRKDLTAYQLRHTFCTNLKLSGLNDYFIKLLMGHTMKSDITYSVYTHANDIDTVIENSKKYFDYIEKKIKSLNID